MRACVCARSWNPGLETQVLRAKSWNRGFGTSTDRTSSFFLFFSFSPGLIYSRCCSGNFRIWFSGHGFRDLGSQLWGLGNFRIWFSRHGFRDLGSQLWGLDFHIRGFQDRNLKTFFFFFFFLALNYHRSRRVKEWVWNERDFCGPM